jgi:hypothetical protein
MGGPGKICLQGAYHTMLPCDAPTTLTDLASVSGNYYVGPQAYPLGKHSFFWEVANRPRICLRLQPRGRVDPGKSPVGGANGASNTAAVCALITRALCSSGDQAAEPSCVR